MQHLEITWRPVPGVSNLRSRVNRHGDTTYAAYYTDRDTGRQRQRTLKARTLTEAKKEQRALAVAADEGRSVAPCSATMDSVADELIASMERQVTAGQIAPRTLEALSYRLRSVRARIGRRPVQRITPDTVAGLDLGLPAYTALRRVLSFAVRHGYISENPCGKLERGERPKASPAEVRVLSNDELGQLLDASEGTWRTLIATVALSGLRQMEALALTWDDVDLDGGYLRVRYQLSRGTKKNPTRRVSLKTDSSARDVILTDALAAILREHRKRQLSRGLVGGDRFVFSTRTGSPLGHRNATRAIATAGRKAGLAVGFHVLRHGYASALIVDLGLDPVQVSRQLGHARPSITLDTYSHLFDQARHAEDIRSRMGSSGLTAAVQARS